MNRKIIFLLIFFLAIGTASAVPSHREGVVLIAGFEPFGENAVNPSMMVANYLNGTTVENKKIYSLSLPVIYFKAADMVKKKMDELSPEIVICLGLDNHSTSIKVERIAWNIIASLHPDNEGTVIIFRPIAFAPLFLPSDLPVMEIAEAMRAANISASPSFFAGAFVCNEVFYETLLYSEKRNIKVGFIHVPNIPSQNPLGMEFEKMVEAVRIAISTCN